MSIDTQPCDIEPDHILRVRDYLRQYGVTDYFYNIITHINRTSPYGFRRLGRLSPRDMIKARHIISSRDNLREFRHRYLGHFAATDRAYKAYLGNRRLGLSVWGHAELCGLKGEQFSRFLEEYGVRSRGVWHLPIPQQPGWFSEYVLLSDLEAEELRRRLSRHQEEVEYQLQLFASRFNELCMSQLNPIVNFNCLSDRALLVLKMTAGGHSSEEVARALSLTESGVYYHLERLKEQFCARNRVQLVSRAHSLGLLV